MHASEAAYSLIRSFEGYREQWYVDLVGIPTVGYGLTEGCLPGLTREACPSGLSHAEADRLLHAYVRTKVEPVVRRHGGLADGSISLHQLQFDALACFVFNVGGGAFTGSTMARLLRAGKMHEAAEQFDRWCYAGGQVVRGLVRRRAAERALFEEGISQLLYGVPQHLTGIHAMGAEPLHEFSRPNLSAPTTPPPRRS